MSILAGCINLESDGPVTSGHFLDQMLSKLKERKHLTITRHENSNFSVAQIDTGAFATKGHLADGEGRFTAIAGWPIVRHNGLKPISRGEDIEILHSSICAGAIREVLQSCCGQFVLFHADPKRRRYVMAADKGGHRPFYYAKTQGQLLFSSALKLLEAIPSAIGETDLRGLTELANFGYSLGDRTPYQNIKLIPIGSYIECQNGHPQSTQYYSILDVKPYRGTREQALDELFLCFQQVVGDRTSEASSQRSFLSGGLDARAVVMMLCTNNVSVETITFDKNGYPDGQVASEFAQAIGVNHHSYEFDIGIDQRELVANVFNLWPPKNCNEGRMIFTGEGGSVGLGCVHFTNTICNELRAHDFEAVANTIVTSTPLVRRIFLPKVYEEIKKYPYEGVLTELQKCATEDPLLSFYLYLLRNDQRRHLHFLFEDIDCYRCEFLTPFYDPRLLEFIASCPLDWFLFHRFYHDWLSRFPKVMSSVPWQTYPGHESCPLALSGGNQWNLPRSKKLSLGVPIAKSALKDLYLGHFPQNLLRRWPIAICAMLQIFRLADKGGTLRTARAFARYGHGEIALV